jgi:hypothetical protein
VRDQRHTQAAPGKCRLLPRLFGLSHEIIGKVSQTAYKRIPRAFGWQKQYAFSHFLDEHMIAFKTKLTGQPDALAAAVLE